MELSDLLAALRRYWFLAVIIWLTCMVVGLVAVELPTKHYEASATALAQPAGSPADINLGTLQLALPQIALRANSRTFSQAVAAGLPKSLYEAPVSVSTTDDTTTGLITVTATSTRQDAVAPWANAFARRILSQLGTSYVVLTPVDSAITPSGPATGSRKTILLGAGVLGLIAALLGVVFASSIRKRRDDSDRIWARFGATVLAEIPEVGRTSSELHPASVFAGQHPTRLLEAFEALQSTLMVRLHSGRHPTIAIVSRVDGEGKSLVAANLAWVLASMGESVALVDANLRHPMLQDYLEQPIHEGLADLTDGSVLSPQRVAGNRMLSFLPAGTAYRHPAELISSNLPGAIALLAESNQVVLVDGPSLDKQVETTAIAAIAGSVIFVVDQTRNDLVDVERSLAELRHAGAEVVGVVINRSRSRSSRRRTGYYYPLPAPQTNGQTPAEDPHPPGRSLSFGPDRP